MGEESSKRSYKNGRIYCIRNYVDNDLYVGCSTQPLSKRMEKHRSNMKNDRDKNTRLYTKMNELGVENFYIELVEEYPCKNIEQLRAREGEWIRKIGTLNKRIEDRTLQEWKEDNAEKMREYHKQYREEHGETLREHHRQYWNEKKDGINERRHENYSNNKEIFKEQREKHRERRREKVECECGSSVCRSDLSTHRRSKKHQEFINNQD